MSITNILDAPSQKEAGDNPGKMVRDLAKRLSQSLAPRQGDGDSLYLYNNGVYSRSALSDLRSLLALDRSTFGLSDYYATQLGGVLRQHATLSGRTSMEPDPGFGNAKYINLKNGMLRVSDLTLFPHDPGYASVTQIPWNWVDDIDTGPTQSLLMAWANGDSDVARLLAWVAGYILRGGNPDKAAFLLYSLRGDSGKSSFQRLLENMVGAGNHSSVSLGQLANSQFAAAGLEGKLLNSAGEVSYTSLGDTSTFMAITGGDAVMIERKGQNAYPGHITAVPVFSGNHHPESGNKSDAWFGRWRVVPFNARFEKDDGSFKESLNTANVVEGLIRLGLESSVVQPSSQEADKANRRFREATDPATEFIEDRFEAGGFTPRAEVGQKFVEWHTRNYDANRNAGKKSLYNLLTTRFGEPTKVHGVWGWRMRSKETITNAG